MRNDRDDWQLQERAWQVHFCSSPKCILGGESLMTILFENSHAVGCSMEAVITLAWDGVG